MTMDEDFNAAEEKQLATREEFVPYVSGATLGQHSGKRVRCWGRVVGVTSSGTEISIKTVDDMDVTVRLQTPIGARPTAWIEAIGTAQGRTIAADEIVPFSEDACQDVAKEGHRDLAHLLAALDDPWNLGEDMH